MNNIFTRKFVELHLLAFIFLFNPIKSDDLICNDDDCRSVLMGEHIIYIKRNSVNYSINYYDFEQKISTYLGDYNKDIKYYKGILKINDTSFLIFGLIAWLLYIFC